MRRRDVAYAVLTVARVRVAFSFRVDEHRCRPPRSVHQSESALRRDVLVSRSKYTCPEFVSAVPAYVSECVFCVCDCRVPCPTVYDRRKYCTQFRIFEDTATVCCCARRSARAHVPAVCAIAGAHSLDNCARASVCVVDVCVCVCVEREHGTREIVCAAVC